MKSLRSLFLLALCLLPTAAQAARVKDLARLVDARHNQLVGYGLVVGLNGTGDSRQTIFTTQSLSSMLNHFGTRVPGEALKVKNVAAVIITVDLPPFLRPGDRVDVLVSSVGDATSLQGGLLVQAPLAGADGQVYAVAQGPVSTNSFSAQASGSAVTKNHPTVGSVPGGALVERPVPTTLVRDGRLTISLNEPDFTTANRLASQINSSLGAVYAKVDDAGAVSVLIPPDYQESLPQLVVRLENLPLVPDTVARVVVNERTGTVVMGADVAILPVAVAQAGLTVAIATQNQVSQPAPFTQGQTAVVPQSSVNVTEGQATLRQLRGATVQELVRSLNAIKASPRDIIAILQAVKRAGALQAELEII